MKEFNELISVTEQLLGPEGCPWDREQTFKSLRSSVLEEAFELIEAIDLNNDAHIREELGDFFFNAIFLCKIAEKENRFSMADALKEITEKLIRRHPHVFGEVKVKNIEALWDQWEGIKKSEKGKSHRESTLDGIPKDLPALSRAQKSLKKIKKAHYKEIPASKIPIQFDDEEELGKILLDIANKAQEKNLDAEHALRKVLSHLEKDFRAFEKKDK